MVDLKAGYFVVVFFVVFVLFAVFLDPLPQTAQRGANSAKVNGEKTYFEHFSQYLGDKVSSLGGPLG